FHALEQLDGFRIAFGQMLFEVAAETQVASEEHVRINVAPDFAQVGDETDLPVEKGHWRNRKIHAHAGRARHLGKGRNADGGGYFKTISRRRVLAQDS